MRTVRRVFATTLLLAAVAFAADFAHAQTTPATAAGSTPGAITSGWTLLKEGQADGTIEADAKHPANSDPHILRIAVTKYASDPGTGRVGAKNTNTMAVREGQDYEVTFTGISEGIGVGLVFSLENDKGQVLARTTLPEIGRGGPGGRGGGRRGGAATDAAPQAATQVAGGGWRKYLVSLHVRTSDPAAHLVITPIESVAVWLDGIAINERK
ncbi:MAG TPA: hypothetical protein VHM90_02625 [Phycisphaerae bacterium]|nr:hypothetical protein [Phycisphaerae bacterium]